ncbi:hypothetical protein LTR86_002616 [Recurvomyces mirabilis]|nr:hypothetical protein LTR86_002616 [Recurvomyces mirabilis]
MVFSKTSSNSRLDANSKVKRKFDNAIPSASERLPAEILEKIFLHCDFKPIFPIQRVSARWRNAITGSSKIQKKLFLSPEGKDKTEKWLRWLPLPRSPCVKGMMLIEMDPEALLAQRQGGSWRNMFVTRPPVRKLKMECMIHMHWDEDEPTTYNATLRNEEGVRLGEIMDKIRPHLAILQSKTQYKVPAYMDLCDDAEVVKRDLYANFVRSLGFELYLSTNKGYISSGSDWGWGNRECEYLDEGVRKGLL